MPPFYSASRFLARLPSKRTPDDQPSCALPCKSVQPPKYGYGPTAALLSDDLDTMSTTASPTWSGVASWQTELEPDTMCTFIPGPDDPTDFMGRLLEIGDVVETSRTLYRSQGEDVKVPSRSRGVIVKLDGDGDALISLDGAGGKKWVRRKHLGTLKKVEEEDLPQFCSILESHN